MRNWRDRLWLWANRKPDSPKSVYCTVIMPWILIAIMATLIFVIISIIIDGGVNLDISPALPFMVLLLVWIAIVIAGLISQGVSYMRDYLDVIYESYLKDRQEQITKARAKIAERR